MADLHQSPLWAQYLEKLGWEAKEIKNSKFNPFDQLRVDPEQSRRIKIQNYIYIKNLSFFGSILKAPKINPPIPFSKIDTIAKKNNALFVKIEPNFPINNTGNYKKIYGLLKRDRYTQDKWALTNTKTIQINLRLPEEELLKNMEKDTRYSIKASQRKGVEIRESCDFEAFLDLYRETARRNRFWVGPLKELKTRWEIFSKKEAATILFAYHKDTNIQPLAAAMVFFWENISYYLHAASSAKKRDFFAPYLILWETIRLSKKRGCEILDLEGIEDSRIPYTKKWRGFSHFKRGFGGEEVTYIGSFTKYYNPLVKSLFKIGEIF